MGGSGLGFVIQDHTDLSVKIIDGSEKRSRQKCRIEWNFAKELIVREYYPGATLLNYGKCSLPIIAMRSEILLSFVKWHLYRLLIQLAVKEVLAHRIELRML